MGPLNARARQDHRTSKAGMNRIGLRETRCDKDDYQLSIGGAGTVQRAVGGSSACGNSRLWLRSVFLLVMFVKNRAWHSV